MSTRQTARPEASDTTRHAPAAPARDDAAALQGYGFRMMSGMGTAWVEVLGEMGSEVMSFVADRIREDVKTQHRMLHCKDVGELQRIQSEFVQTAIEQYKAETGKLVELSQQFFKAPRDDGGDRRN